ncbi:WD40 repeat domain-containing protein [Rapidithrix thailandica]|uniref:WD40 repeat domain-containing protein n=1 Tax=Rapidithrix thailandica TaxID=413964 RepID=A0AAW9SAX9_9BACT
MKAPIFILLFLHFSGISFAQNRLKLPLPDQATVLQLASSPNGQYLAAAYQNHTIGLWDIPSGKLLRLIPAHKDMINDLRFSPDGKTFASSSRDHTAKIWTCPSGQKRQAFGENFQPGQRDYDIQAIAYSSDGKWLATGSKSMRIRIYDTSSGQQVKTLRAPAMVHSLQFDTNDQQLLVGFHDGITSLMDLASEQEVAQYSKHTGQVISVSFHPDSQPLLATAGSDKIIQLWNTQQQELLFTLHHSNPLLSITFHPKGQYLFALEGHHFQGWNLQTGKPAYQFSFPDKELSALTISQDGQQVVLGSATGEILFLNAYTGELSRSLPRPKDEHPFVSSISDSFEE